MNTSIRIRDIQKAVAKECRYLGDTSKDTTRIITKLYLNQLKKDGFTVIPHEQTIDTNAKRINFFIDHED